MNELSADQRPVDFRAREQALDVERSFIVQAPAGSGKTELLIQRYLKLLARVESPEQVLAITFTRKAAGEMRNRVMESLDMALGEQPSEAHKALTWSLARQLLERDRLGEWNLRSRPARMAIMTIDSFNSMLARRISLPAGFPAGAGISDRPAELYELAAERVLEHLGSAGPAGRCLEILVGHLDNHLPRVVKLLSGMLSRRDQWLRLVAGAGSQAGGRAFLEDSIARAVQGSLVLASEKVSSEIGRELIDIAREAVPLNPGTGLPVHACAALKRPPGTGADQVESWRALASMVLTGTGSLRKSVDKRSGFPAEKKELKARMKSVLDELASIEGADQVLSAARDLPAAEYSESQWQVLEALLTLLQLAAAELDVLFGEREQTDYAAVAMAAGRALGREDEPTDLALYLDHRLQHILVDEFQDTSHGQYELLRKLVAGWTGQDGRTLFCVGDPMQAIYRFREAKVGYFLNARKHGIGSLPLEPLLLEANFRSRPGVIDWVNTVFPDVFAGEENSALEAIRYSPCQSTRGDGPSPAVQVHGWLGRRDVDEARGVAEIAREALARNSDAQVAVLVRSRTHLQEVTRQLRACGIAYRAVDIESLSDRPVVLDLMALTRAVLHMADRTAWLSLLHAPFVGLDESDLLALSENAGDGCIARPIVAGQWQGVSDDGRRRLSRCAPVLEKVISRRGRRTLRATVEGTWLGLGGPAALGSPADLEDAEAFLGLLESVEQGADLDDLGQLETLLKEQRAAGTSAADARVQIMTIHKSKGLEFQTVIIPGLGKRGRGDDQPLLRWEEVVRQDSENDLLLAPLSPHGDENDPLHMFLGRMERQRNEQELKRLLYVGVTRAREQLHLLGHATELKDGTIKADSGSLLSLLWPHVSTYFESLQASPEPVPMEPGRVSLCRLEADWSPPPADHAPFLQPPAQAVSRAAGQPLEFDWASESIRFTGTVVHRYLQQIAEQGSRAWPLQRIGKERSRIARALRNLGLPEARVADAADRAVAALEATLEDDRGRWILFGDHRASWTELALTGATDSEPVNVVMDRVIEAVDGTFWIVDYKSSRHEGADIEAFLESEKQRYSGQLHRYGTVLRAWKPGVTVRLALYFPLMRAWCELESATG